jgi:F0F1-type ATP synthase membrane subunit b/b'
MTFLYLGPGVGIGGLIAAIGIFVAVLFILYAFVFLPIRKQLRKRKQQAQQSQQRDASSPGSSA